MYLIRKHNPKVYHVMNGTNTFCKMLETGGINKKKNVIVDIVFDDVKVCTMCSNNMNKEL